MARFSGNWEKEFRPQWELGKSDIGVGQVGVASDPGNSKKICTSCGGTGRIVCYTCNGVGRVKASSVGDATQQCSLCVGMKTTGCSTCRGTGSPIGGKNKLKG